MTESRPNLRVNPASPDAFPIEREGFAHYFELTISLTIGSALTSLPQVVNIRRLLDWRLVVASVFFLSVCVSGLSDVFVYIPDSARYLVWAESLSHLQGLTDNSGPDPIRYVVHAPLYALLLTPAAYVFPGSVAAAKILTVLFGLGLLILVYFYLAERAGKLPAALGVLFLAVNPLQILYSTQILSDVPFAALFMSVLILIDRMVLRPARVDGALVLLSLLMSAAMLLREVGIALVIACALLFLVRREYPRMAAVVLVPLVVYAVWLLRNEVLVAGLENPPLRNSDLLTSHLYTVREAPLVTELLARISSNARIYAGIAGKLLVFTQYDVRGYGIISPAEFAFGWLMRHAGLLIIPVSILTAGLFFYGLWDDWKRRESTRIVVFFLFVYVPLILVYPFNDIRFLFPLLIVMLLFAVTGLASAVKRILGESPPPKAAVAGGALCFLLLIVPNCAWIYSFVDNNLRYRSDPEKYYGSMIRRPDAPELLMFPMTRIGEWLTGNTEPSAVIATRWKQLSFWLGGRKLLELNPMLPVDQFENQLRDYRVGYLVALLDRSRLREFETQMALSSHFSFTPVHRIGNAVIIQVERAREREHPDSPVMAAAGENYLDSLSRADEQLQCLFRSGLQSMDSGRPEEAEEIFQNLSTRAGRSGTVVLHTAIARSFAGRFQEAETLLRNVREGQQAGPLLVHSWYHLQIIEKLRQADREADPSGRADIMTKVAGDYWSLGFRQQAERILKKAIETDPGFSPALVFGIYFDLQRRDTVSAKERLRQLRSIDLSHPTVGPFGGLLAGAEAAAKEGTVSASLTYRETVARNYERLGLVESAIDELCDILARDPFRLSALRSLAKIYVERQRYAPAKRILQRISEVAPADPVLKELGETLKSRWGE